MQTGLIQADPRGNPGRLAGWCRELAIASLGFICELKRFSGRSWRFCPHLFWDFVKNPWVLSDSLWAPGMFSIPLYVLRPLRSFQFLREPLESSSMILEPVGIFQNPFEWFGIPWNRLNPLASIGTPCFVFDSLGASGIVLNDFGNIWDVLESCRFIWKLGLTDSMIHSGCR